MPEGFAYPLQAELWVTQRFTEETLRTQRGAHYLEVIARLADGTAPARAQDALRATASALAERHPRTNAGRSAFLEPLRDAMVGDVRTALLKQVTIRAVNYGAFRRAVALLVEGRLDLEGLIGDVLPLEQFADAFEQARSSESAKLFLDPTGEHVRDRR